MSTALPYMAPVVWWTQRLTTTGIDSVLQDDYQLNRLVQSIRIPTELVQWRETERRQMATGQMVLSPIPL